MLDKRLWYGFISRLAKYISVLHNDQQSSCRRVYISGSLANLPMMSLLSSHLAQMSFSALSADTGTDTDSPYTATILRPTHAISSRGSSRGCPCRCRRRGMPALVNTKFSNCSPGCSLALLTRAAVSDWSKAT